MKTNGIKSGFKVSINSKNPKKKPKRYIQLEIFKTSNENKKKGGDENEIPSKN